MLAAGLRNQLTKSRPAGYMRDRIPLDKRLPRHLFTDAMSENHCNSGSCAWVVRHASAACRTRRTVSPRPWTRCTCHRFDDDTFDAVVDRSGPDIETSGLHA
jgi:hypothetical protein